MILTIDNLNGRGPLDYSTTLAAKPSLRIQRQLNQPSTCSFTLMPLRLARITVSDDSGVVLFTGYAENEPVLTCAGEGVAGPVYEAVVSAVSDEILLDMQGISRQVSQFALPASQTAQLLTGLVNANGLTMNTSAATGIVGRFVANAGETWSGNVGLLASSSGNLYRVISGGMTLAPVGGVTHTLSENDGTLVVSRLQASMTKMLANDITVCGEEEPAAYVTEVFTGDGTTVLFDLTEEPFFPSSSKAHPLVDLFQTPLVNLQLWQLQDTGSYLSITANGLTCTGGNGLDGETILFAGSDLELGGSLVIETSGVTINAGSTGILSGLYAGDINTANCLAGFQVSQSSGNTVISPLVEGLAVGSSFSPVAGHVYVLRTRLYAKEMQRVQQAYYAMGASGIELWGGDAIPCGVNLVLEIQDTTNGVNATPVVLYDGSIAATPSICTFGLINSTNLQCSIRSVSVAQEGPTWVTSIPPGGNMMTRRIGTTAQVADCKIERTGKLRFYPTSVPQMGELIFVSYRTRHRSVARKANNTSVSPQNSAQLPSISRWMGTVTSPKAMSSVDCENAAAALLSLSSSRAAAWEGTYTGWNMEAQSDIWPGDLLAVHAPSAGMDVNLIVRSVEIEVACTVPQLNRYSIRFANDWADALAIKTSLSVPADTWLPQQPQSAEPLVNLPIMTATVSSSAIQVNAGITAPSGGGFEVRRRDWFFGPGTDSDLVLRSPVSNFSIPREAVMEQYYVRAYDGATPPNYSRFSSAIFVNMPLL